jgi:cell division protein FtsB
VTQDGLTLPRWIVAVIVVTGMLLAGGVVQVVQIGRQLHQDALNHEIDVLRREASELQHRIRQEECVIGPLNDTIRHRINDRTSAVIPLCTSFEHLPDLRAKLERLDRQLADLDG